MKNKDKKLINPYFKMAEVMDEILMDLLIEEFEKNGSNNDPTIDVNKLFLRF